MLTWMRLHVVRTILLLLILPALFGVAFAESVISGRITDPQGKVVAGARVKLTLPNGSLVSEAHSDEVGHYMLPKLGVGPYRLSVSAAGFVSVDKDVSVLKNQPLSADLQFERVEAQSESMVITAKIIEPTVDLRNGEVFNRTLFTRDDQVFQQLNAGINVGQHEGGGKSLEIRRFGFSLDHGGVNGGLKVMVDDVQQNQGSQGHGQGYLGSLKALSPELIQDVTIINGPFSAEYGDFSGLGVVHIRQRESLPDQFTARLEAATSIPAAVFWRSAPTSRTSTRILLTKVPTPMDHS